MPRLRTFRVVAGLALAAGLVGGAVQAVALPGAPVAPLSPGVQQSSGAQQGPGAQQQLPGVHNYLNTVAGLGCSGSVVRFTTSQPTDKALVMTNGHCAEPTPGYGENYFFNKATRASFTLIKADGTEGAAVKSSLVVYATQIRTDIAIYQLDLTYEQLRSKHGVDGLVLAEKGPAVGDTVALTSGYHEKRLQCTVDRQVMALESDGPGKDWQLDAVRYPYTGTCKTSGGFSGSPILDPRTGHLLAIHNSGNQADKTKGCTGDAACEISPGGRKEAFPSMGYAVPTTVLYTCLNVNRQIDVKVNGCKLTGGNAAVRKPF